jgi:hypothetical protein
MHCLCAQPLLDNADAVVIYQCCAQSQHFVLQGAVVIYQCCAQSQHFVLQDAVVIYQCCAQTQHFVLQADSHYADVPIRPKFSCCYCRYVLEIQCTA